MDHANTRTCCGPSRPFAERERVHKTPDVRFRKQKPEGNDMVSLPGGVFTMGTDDAIGYARDGECPSREVHLASFSIDRCAVTNKEFARFIDATGYVTEAERYGWSFVFQGHLSEEQISNAEGRVRDFPWWFAIRGAEWRSPCGGTSAADDLQDHPVVHVSHNDALAFCRWTDKRLPTEAEWEYAARGGENGRTFPWGDYLTPDDRHRCNIWQGMFPTLNTAEDGWTGTCPVRTYEQNGFGLYNVIGNVWEWCGDWFAVDSSPSMGDYVLNNPLGPSSGAARVIRGGSYLCHDSYCNRYRLSARSSNTPESSTGNTGFRCARTV